jgi:hypothetical protein
MNTVVYSKIAGWIVEGENIKRNGERRHWIGKLTGQFRHGVRGDKQVMIIEEGRKKWLSLATFTGTIGEVKLVEGERPDQQQSFNF